MTVIEFLFPPENLIIGTHDLLEYKSTLFFQGIFRDDLLRDKNDSWLSGVFCQLVPKSHSIFPPSSESQRLLFLVLPSRTDEGIWFRMEKDHIS